MAIYKEGIKITNNGTNISDVNLLRKEGRREGDYG